MIEPGDIDRAIRQGRALVCATEGLGTIDPSAWFEWWRVRLLQAAHRKRLRADIATVPPWAPKQILSASEHVGNDSAAVWIRENRP